jgi:acetyltransferase
MSTYRLDRLFVPRSIAVIGGSPRATSPGRAVLKNLRSGGFAGSIQLVNPHYDNIEGIAAAKSYARRTSPLSPCRLQPSPRSCAPQRQRAPPQR